MFYCFSCTAQAFFSVVLLIHPWDYRSHDKDCSNSECPVFDLIYGKKEELMIPKIGKAVVITLRFQVKPRVNLDTLEVLDTELLNPVIFKKLMLKGIIEKRKKRIYVANYNKYQDWEIKQFQYEWQELILFGDRIWSISIERYNSTSFNGTLVINIIPEKNTYFSYRSIKASLHLNVLSFDLVNLNLFETSIGDSIETAQKLLPLLTTLFMDRDIHIFSRNSSITKEDLIEKASIGFELDERKSLSRAINNLKEDHREITEENINIEKEKIKNDSNPSMYRRMFYTILCKEIIKDRLIYTNARLIQFTISEQRQYQGDIDLGLSLYSKIAVKKYLDSLSNDPDIRTKELEDMSVYPHKASSGLTISNYKRGFSMSVYNKDRRWLQNKVMRIANRRDLTKTQIKKILESELREGLIRYELAIFGLEEILMKSNDHLLGMVSKYLDKVMKVVNDIDEYFSDELSMLDEELPFFYVESDLFEYEESYEYG